MEAYAHHQQQPHMQYTSFASTSQPYPMDAASMNPNADGLLYNHSHDVGNLASGMTSSIGTSDVFDELGYSTEVLPIEATATSLSSSGPVPATAPSSESSTSSKQESNYSHLTPHVTHVTGPSSSDTSASTALGPGSLVHDSGSTVSFSGGISHSTPLSRPLTHKEQELLAHLDRLKFFLATAPSRWSETEVADDNGAQGWNGTGTGRIQRGTPMMPHPNMHPALNRFLLPSGEYVTCILWSGLYHITGTDIVRALVFRFEAFGRPVRNMKKFEEGIFSDLRNLKPGTDACLEDPKSPFLDLLFKYQCIRTQKKQKVFYWFSVPHDRLFLDALERDLKREKMSQEPTTQVVGEPALSFTYDAKRSLYEQFSKAHGGVEGEDELEAAVRRANEVEREADIPPVQQQAVLPEISVAQTERKIIEAPTRRAELESHSSADESAAESSTSRPTKKGLPAALQGPGSPFFNMVSLFEGSPNYKQRRKKMPKSLNRMSGDPSMQGYLPIRSSSDDIYEGVDDPYGDMSAAAMFDAQANLGMGMSRQELMRRQMETQALLQHQHLVRMNGQQQQIGMGTPPMQPVPLAQMHQMQQLQMQQQQQFPNAVMQQHSMGLTSASLQDLNVEHRQTIPMMSQGGGMHAHTRSLPMNVPNGGDPSDSSQDGFNRMSPEYAGGVPTVKAFVCPLFSCGRLFKRMEHLKRHLRTHTMEKPYQCQMCNKRFSRSDNLNQHIRTHSKDGSETMTGGSSAEFTDTEGDEDELEGDEVDFPNNDRYSDALGLVMTGLDPKMCEVEVPSHVQDIHGDEEGLSGGESMPTVPQQGGEYYEQAVNSSQPQFAHVVTSPENSPNLFAHNTPLPTDTSGGQWTQQRSTQPTVAYDMYGSPHPSPAFTAMSVPSPLPQIATLHQEPVMYDLPQTVTVQRSFSQGDYTSTSAPAHRQTFPQSSMYLSELGLGLSNGPGPIRRYRSVTPTVPRGGENIQRPSSASNRAFHPYALRREASSLAGSAHSSPAPVHSQLEYVQQQVAAERRLSRPPSHSRSSSSHLQDQMQHMLNLDHVDDMNAYQNAVLNGTMGVNVNQYSEVFLPDATNTHYMVGDGGALQLGLGL